MTGQKQRCVEPFIFDRQELKLQVLDQRHLPAKIVYENVADSSDGFKAIVNMLVRGAPCIAVVGILSVLVEANKFFSKDDKLKDTSASDLLEWFRQKSEYMKNSRPTAVNLSRALDKLICYISSNVGVNANLESSKLLNLIKSYCIGAIDVGLELNKQLGDFGARHILDENDNSAVTVLTHCNTGSLATVGYGTALGVIRSLHKFKKLGQIYCTETRPYNQGSRLTAFELDFEGLPATLIVDSAVSYLIQKKGIDAVIVGADAVAENGDTANKIGTFNIAVACKNFNVPFYVAMPFQTLSLGKVDSSRFVIEERPESELKCFGDAKIAPDGIKVWNPCFDVTPNEFITGFITEYGVYSANELTTKLLEAVKSKSDAERGLF